MGVKRLLGDERGSGWVLFVEILGVVTGLLTLWEFGARFDVLPIPGPIEIGQEVVEDWPNLPEFENDPSPPPFDPDLPGGDDVALATPSDVHVVDPSCAATKLAWTPVEGATGYRVQSDDAASHHAFGPELTFRPPPDGQTHTYRVVATAPGAESAPSDPVTVGPCTF